MGHAIRSWSKSLATLGVVALAITACGAEGAEQTSSTSAVQAATVAVKDVGPYRFARPPLVIFAPNGTGFDVYVFAHLNRSLPRDARGPAATIAVEGLLDQAFTLTHRIPCYAVELYTGDAPIPPSLRKLEDDQKVTVTLRVLRRYTTTVTAHAHRVPKRTLANSIRLGRQTAKVGCPAGPA